MQYNRYATTMPSTMPPTMPSGMAMLPVMTRQIPLSSIPMQQGMPMSSALPKLQPMSMPTQSMGLPPAQTSFYRSPWSRNHNPNQMPMGYPSIPCNSPYGPMSYRPPSVDPNRSYPPMNPNSNMDYYRTRDEQGVTYTYGPRVPSRSDPYTPDPPYE